MKTEQELREWWYSDEGRLPITRIVAHLRKCNPDGIPGVRSGRKSATKEYNAQKQREYNKRHPYLTRSIKFHLAHAVSVNMYHSIKLTKKGRKWETLVDYTVEQLMKHLQKQFTVGMSWDNYGGWHIDHIIPVSAFHFTSTDDFDFKRCWTLLNLQPLWAKENMSKHTDILQPFQPSLKF